MKIIGYWKYSNMPFFLLVKSHEFTKLIFPVTKLDQTNYQSISKWFVAASLRKEVQFRVSHIFVTLTRYGKSNKCTYPRSIVGVFFLSNASQRENSEVLLYLHTESVRCLSTGSIGKQFTVFVVLFYSIKKRQTFKESLKNQKRTNIVLKGKLRIQNKYFVSTCLLFIFQSTTFPTQDSFAYKSTLCTEWGSASKLHRYQGYTCKDGSSPASYVIACCPATHKYGTS